MTTRVGARFIRLAAAVGAAVAALVATGSPARAQTIGTSIPIPYTTFIGVNPMAIPFDIGSIEVESGVAQGITLGGLASVTALDNDHYVSFDFKARYYPSEVVLRGFSLGLSVGSLRYSALADSAKRQVLTAPTIGLLTDYNWMLGTSHRFIVGTGLGAKRILASQSERERVGISNYAYLTARFVVGLAF